ncbi:MAG TPA: NADH-quinone oxidoreductase subunit H [Solirubrobacterales bacterium]|nr:NADH-quinone oxidoreductase subunit H [Solirubrobacterales bacterium]
MTETANTINTLVAGVVQVGGGVVLAPLLPGLVQSFKGRLQGRRGPSPFQPYRELARLWTRSPVSPEGVSAIYGVVPAVVAASLALALLLVPIGGVSPEWPVGHDALLVVGLLALARFALAASAWDTGSGFGLMSAARDLTLGVAVEGLLLLVLVLASLPLGSTDLRSLSDAAAGAAIWTAPAHWMAALGFALVVIAETGRQPVDNPDTHLELTMIHEGPLLEYAGRDLAFLQWAAAARHWIVLTLAVELFLPHPTAFAGRLLALAVGLPVLCFGLALVESWQAKMRLLRVPRLLAMGAAFCLVGLITWFAGGRL